MKEIRTRVVKTISNSKLNESMYVDIQIMNMLFKEILLKMSV